MSSQVAQYRLNRGCTVTAPPQRMYKSEELLPQWCIFKMNVALYT